MLTLLTIRRCISISMMKQASGTMRASLRKILDLESKHPKAAEIRLLLGSDNEG